MSAFKKALATTLVVWHLAVVAQCNSFLAQQALDKVLRDASQVFGIHTKGNVSTATWMRHHADSTPIVHLNIPGAHDAATWNFSTETRDSITPGVGVQDPLNFRCQRRSIADMLDGGIRFFDMRYALDPTDTYLVFWHHNALLSELSSVESVLFGFYAWLDAHRSEAVLLSLQYEGGTKPGADNTPQVQAQLRALLTSPAARRYLVQTEDALGTLGPARGKLLLLRRFDLPAGPGLPGLHLSPALWTDNSRAFALPYAPAATAFVEDYYEPADLPATAAPADNIAAKMNAVAAHLHAAATSHPGSLFVTFASGRRLDVAPPVFPLTMALGNGSALTPRGGVNQQLVPVLRGLAGQKVGVVVLDFWEEPAELVELVLGLS